MEWQSMECEPIFAEDYAKAQEVAKNLDPSLRIGNEVPPIPPEGEGKWFKCYCAKSIDGKPILPETKVYAYNIQDARNMAKNIHGYYDVENTPLKEVDDFKPTRSTE